MGLVAYVVAVLVFGGGFCALILGEGSDGQDAYRRRALAANAWVKGLMSSDRRIRAHNHKRPCRGALRVSRD